jgi:hypothetical protein
VTSPGATDDLRLDLQPDSTTSERREAALAAIARWRMRASDPLNDSALTEVCDTLARTFEAIYVRTL